ncbi:unnamed protein product [Cuscuta campestris]|uniref:Uncharacterized protein n=1 Tax=Cuscuta campestris TaxID=132261 RepID=A0A484LC05_9ASTE|nr:unnamed protein product [Cuscuta campestris]
MTGVAVAPGRGYEVPSSSNSFNFFIFFFINWVGRKVVRKMPGWVRGVEFAGSGRNLQIPPRNRRDGSQLNPSDSGVQIPRCWWRWGRMDLRRRLGVVGKLAAACGGRS